MIGDLRRSMELLVLLFLILLNGLFSMSEIALVSARKARLEADAQRGDARARTALDLANDPTRFLGTVQIGITLIGILTGIHSGEEITADVAGYVRRIAILAPYAHGLATTVVVVIVTFFFLVLGELVPKRIGMSMPEPIAKAVAIPMRAFAVAIAPFNWLLSHSSNGLLHLLGIRPQAGGGVTEDEIRAMVQQGTAGGEVQPIEQDIVERVFTLGDRRISSLMTHRTDLVTLVVGMDREQVRTVLHGALHNTYPVLARKGGPVIGVVGLKDLMLRLDDPGFDLPHLVREPQYLHEDLPAYRALELFKGTGVHDALVTDELGALVGLLTISDILQALVGDVSDFHGEDLTLTERKDGSWLVDGQYPLHDLLVRLGRSQFLRDVAVDTVGGLLIYQLGRVPRVGDQLGWMGMQFEVMDMDGARVDKVLVWPG